MRGPVVCAVVLAGLTVAPGAAVAAPAPTPPTGRLLVTLRPPAHGTAQAAAARAVAARAGARPAGLSVPQLRLVGVRARHGASLRALARRLRADPAVASVRAERRFTLRYVPDDPALTDPEPRAEPGTVVEWWAARESLPSAWDVTRGDGARVAVIDTGVDATHPDLAARIVATADFDADSADGPATVDEVGHGTHVASLACATSGNGIGLAGAGGNCDLLIAKSDLTEGSVAEALVWAADNGAQSIVMSFGTDGRVPASDAVVQALRYAAAHGSVLVAAAADDPVTEQGDPANVLQPTGTGPDITQNLGLSVTAATAADARASFAGRGGQISMAAYGTYGGSGPNGLLGAFPAQTTALERGGPTSDQPPCHCRTTFDGDPRYAYLPGTSMAAPQVAAVAALMRAVNPALPPADVVRLLKQTAHRPSAVGWTGDLGWGILDAGAAMAAARAIDRTAPTSSLQRPVVRGRSIRLRWRGEDDTLPGVASTGIDHFEVWRSAGGRPARRIATTRARSMQLRGMRGQRYGFFTIAVDRAGNREAPPVRADASVRIARR
ncbi:S8 family serine peptidase [Baekduia soli]|uniref:S8 family serine peptidase n=1 Tax=Baekduia soli TaxID=496014 RepID=A0A5B8UAC0_9ACTN|nr:S8 family serine peptidase [Baekduia soli]QEC49977.1 S8 family serine peptidase [Baekduia soli]